MMKNMYVVVVFLCVVSGVASGWADTSSGDPAGAQNQSYSFVDGGSSGPYVDETLTIDLLWNKVSMLKFDAEKDARAVLVVTRLTPDKTISWGFVGVNNSLFRLDDFLSGPDTVFVRDVRLDKNNHVFTHVFGETGAGLRIQVLPPLPAITSFAVTPAHVTAGAPAVLAWSTVQADSVVIEPGIGDVGPEGSTQVTPEATTAYTLTAGNGYGSTSVSVQLEVLYPPELVITEPDGQGDTAGGSFVISWTDEDPDSNAAISLFYDTDSAGANGTLITAGLTEDPDGTGDQYPWNTASLAPGRYYVYAVIDDGRNDPVVVYSPGPVTVAAAAAPTVSITAVPESIASGASVVLSWTSTDADRCFIEPDVGTVSATGSTTVTPVATTIYAITATGPGGTAADSVTVQVDCPLTVSIDYPPEGDLINRPDTLVTGTIENVAGRAAAVTVNDMVAVVHGSRFAVNHVPLEDGENTITVTAEDVTGCRHTMTRHIYADTSGDYIDLSPTLETGLPVFTTDLYINGSFPVASSSLQIAGPDTAVLTKAAADEYRLEVAGEGIYILTAEVTYEGLTYRDEIAITSLNRETVDAEVNDVWNRMKALLISNNREKALDLFHPVARDHQRQVFDLLADDLPGIISAMRDIRLVTVENNRAEYRVERERIIQGQPYDITYYIIFSRTGQGWRIVNF